LRPLKPFEPVVFDLFLCSVRPAALSKANEESEKIKTKQSYVCLEKSDKNIS